MSKSRASVVASFRYGLSLTTRFFQRRRLGYSRRPTDGAACDVVGLNLDLMSLTLYTIRERASPECCGCRRYQQIKDV